MHVRLVGGKIETDCPKCELRHRLRAEGHEQTSCCHEELALMLVAKQRAHHMGLHLQPFPGMLPVFIHFFWNSQFDLCAEIPADFLRRVRKSCNVEQVMHTYKPRSKENNKVSSSRSCPRFRSRSSSHNLCLLSTTILFGRSMRSSRCWLDLTCCSKKTLWLCSLLITTRKEQLPSVREQAATGAHKD